MPLRSKVLGFRSGVIKGLSYIMSPFARAALAAVALVYALLFSLGQASAEGVGPSFPCSPNPTDALARLTCLNPAMAKADLTLVQTYYALRQLVGNDGWKPLRSEFLNFIVDTRRSCGLPPVEPGRDQSQDPVPPSAADCVIAAYEKEQSAWARRLTGPAAEEAARPVEQNLALQVRLQTLGFLPKDARMDGVFGTATRAAVLAWQHSAGLPETGFLSDADAAVLLPGGQASPPDEMVAYRIKPLASARYAGKPVSVSYKTLKVSLQPDTSDDPSICQPPGDKSKLVLPAVGDTSSTSCGVASVKVTVGDKEVLKAPIASFDKDTSIDGLNIKIAIRKLDPATALPQIVLSGFTGGAHCCTVTSVLTEAADGSWKVACLGEMDGDRGYGFLDIGHDGSTELVDIADGFLYEYASYAGSYAPTRIQVFGGNKLKNVTTDPRYRDFLLHELKEMEKSAPQPGQDESNGYWAAWVAQKALVDQLKEAWAVLLKSYDHDSTAGRETCAVDKSAWRKLPDVGLSCPPGEQELLSFPEALALHLVELGYMTPKESAALGFDPAERAKAVKAATQRYNAAVINSWFVITHKGDCIIAQTPNSPADLIQNDLENGLEDDVDVQDKDSDGKPVIVKVGSPRGNNLVSEITFYRGLARCEASWKAHQEELNDLK